MFANKKKADDLDAIPWFLDINHNPAAKADWEQRSAPEMPVQRLVAETKKIEIQHNASNGAKHEKC